MLSLLEALYLVAAMGLIILFCRAFPFLFFGKGSSVSAQTKIFLNFVEKTVPPAAMTVLAFNAIGSSFVSNHKDGILVLTASIFTAAVHLWKKNALFSIITGTAIYMILKYLTRESL